MSDEARKRVDGAKKGEKEKRKKLWDDKHESEPSKKKRKLDEKGEAFLHRIFDKRSKLTSFLARLAAERAEQLAREKEEKEQEKAALAAAARARAKAKAIKYPTEDLNVPHNKRGSSKPVRRPAFDRTIPFGSSFERFLMTWNFMTTFGFVLLPPL
jgi:bromodomain adjacent to zinc finger domain protein 1A